MLDNEDTRREQRSVFAATELGEDLKLDSNDALAVDFMRLNSINEIYTFDEDFDKIDRISRLPKP